MTGGTWLWSCPADARLRTMSSLALYKKCLLLDCEAPFRTMGLCLKHYTRLRRHGDPRVTLHGWTKCSGMICTIQSCKAPAKASGWCEMHYRRFKRHGDPQARYHQPKLEDMYIPEPNSGCWLWLGSVTQSGYGNAWTNGKNMRAHRLSWMIHNGDIPKEMCVLHRCDTPACINPGHLFLGTQLENIKDRDAKGRHGKRGPRKPATGRVGN